MKRIEIHPITGSESGFVVGDNEETPGDGVGTILDISPNYNAMVELVPISQAVSPSAFNRYNESTGISVQVDYGFASEGARDSFLIDLQSNVPVIGHVFIGMTSSAWWIPFCKCRPISARAIGDSAAIVSYTFEGQKMQRSRPLTPPS